MKFYVTPKTIKLMKLRDIAKEVAKNETLSPQEVEHVLKPALARMSPERLAQLGGDFALERCPARPGYERLLRRRCGAAFTETL